MKLIGIDRDVELVCELIHNKLRDGSRTIIGIAGPPASGKSTLAREVVKSLNRNNSSSGLFAELLPMDGYHLDNHLLKSLKLLSKKGSPETFDAYGFCEAVKSLSCTTRESFHPTFDRKMDLAIANSILIKPETPVVVIEGNYLLMETKPWSSLLKVFSSTVFVCPPMATIQDRLMQRWLSLGLNPDDAMLKITSNDLVNTKLIIDKSQPPDLYLNQNYTKKVYLE